MKTKFVWNGIKVDGKLYRAHYLLGHLAHYPEHTITIYARDLLVGLPRIGFTVEDYFEMDMARITVGAEYYADALAAYEMQEAHKAKKHAKYFQRRPVKNE